MSVSAILCFGGRVRCYLIAPLAGVSQRKRASEVAESKSEIIFIGPRQRRPSRVRITHGSRRTQFGILMR
jgi:hypothetical protein